MNGTTKQQAQDISAELSREILAAAAALGLDGRGKYGIRGFLMHLAAEHPRIYAQLLGRVLEQQLSRQPEIEKRDKLAELEKVRRSMREKLLRSSHETTPECAE